MQNNNFLKLKIYSTVFLATLLTSCGVETTTTSDVAQPTPTQAARILTQATFGATIEDINRIQTIGTGAWFNDQFNKPQTKHFDYVVNALPPPNSNNNIDDSTFQQSFWRQAITGQDQLRQRVTFALSQILVISFQNNTLASMPRGVASYYDMLGSHAFGNFRNLLEDVTLHPMMGIYLSSLGNQSSNGTAREPDQNYAREVMQLFTIGLEVLDPNTGQGTGVPTYTNEDIVSLANVFTGWSWGGPDKNKNRFLSTPSSSNIASATVDPNRDWLPMQNYPLYHETGDITFPAGSILNIPTIHAGTSGEASLKIVLDALFKNNNVPYFIGRRLIQRLVTSNPSNDYVGRVAAAFKDNGCGCANFRGDMKTVIKAVLLDPEALDPTYNAANRTPPYDPNAVGKLREPVIRLANWMRAFHVTSASGSFPLANLDGNLGQTPMNSPTVFNFYQPGYQPPGSVTLAAGKVAPEMQITDETTVVNYLNYIQGVIPNGTGTGNDIKADYTAELALASTPDLLVDRINMLLVQNKMSPDLKSKIVAAVTSISPNNTTSAKNRVSLAIFLTMASPEYIVQK